MSPRKPSKVSSELFNQTLSFEHDELGTVEASNSPKKERFVENMNRIRLNSIDRQNDIIKEDLQVHEIYSNNQGAAQRMSHLSMVNSIAEEDVRGE